MLRKVLVFALTSTVAAAATQLFLKAQKAHARRLHRQEKVALHRWEGEGGNVIEPQLPTGSRRTSALS